jgi:hypothetical protein
LTQLYIALMYEGMKNFNVEIKVSMPSKNDFNSATDAAENGNSQPLRDLCRKEVDRFEAYLKKSDPWFVDGLASLERKAVEGYLYQKLRGHMDAPEIEGLPK